MWEILSPVRGGQLGPSRGSPGSLVVIVGGLYDAGMALRGLKVVEMAGLAPVPFAGMILAGKPVEHSYKLTSQLISML